jgi:hydroxymethylbilane synthase
VRRSRKPIVIAARRSTLARTQAELVGAALGRLHPRLAIEFRWIESEGDLVTSSLADAGGKGLFTRAIEQALLDGRADIAVHSMKDLPSSDTPGLTIAATPKRADVRDCLISPTAVRSIDALPRGAVVGTSSPRRGAQLLRLRPDLRIEPIRGNVETRIHKVLGEAGASTFDATLLAAAGLSRLGLGEHLEGAVDTDEVLPAACQGALAIQCRADDSVTLTRTLPLNDATTATAVHAERRVVAALEADCHSPLAVLVEPVEPQQRGKRKPVGPDYRVRIRALSPDGRQCLEVDQQAPMKQLRRLIKDVVKDLKSQGAVEVMGRPFPPAGARQQAPPRVSLSTSPAATR